MTKKGIYKITNKINKKSYIGLSIDIEERWRAHINNSSNQNSKEYEKTLYRAFRKHGIENFLFEILEEREDFLEEREKFWIEKYDSYKNGYNETLGGEIGNMQKWETHNRAVLKNQDVINIRNRYNNKERLMEVYEDYKDVIDINGFRKVWRGETWKGLHDHVYTEENKNFQKNNSAMRGSKNGRAILTEEDVYSIRLRRRNGESKEEVYKNYENKLSYGSFKNVWYGYNWKHVIV